MMTSAVFVMLAVACAFITRASFDFKPELLVDDRELSDSSSTPCVFDASKFIHSTNRFVLLVTCTSSASGAQEGILTTVIQISTTKTASSRLEYSESHQHERWIVTHAASFVCQS